MTTLRIATADEEPEPRMAPWQRVVVGCLIAVCAVTALAVVAIVVGVLVLGAAWVWSLS